MTRRPAQEIADAFRGEGHLISEHRCGTFVPPRPSIRMLAIGSTAPAAPGHRPVHLRRHALWPPFTEPARKSPSHSYRGTGIIMAARPHRTNSLIALPSKTTAMTGRTITGGSQVVTSCLSRKSSLRQRSPRQWKNVHRRPRGARAAADRYRSTCQRAKRRRLRIRTTSIAAKAKPPTM